MSHVRIHIYRWKQRYPEWPLKAWLRSRFKVAPSVSRILQHSDRYAHVCCCHPPPLPLQCSVVLFQKKFVPRRRHQRDPCEFWYLGPHAFGGSDTHQCVVNMLRAAVCCSVLHPGNACVWRESQQMWCWGHLLLLWTIRVFLQNDFCVLPCVVTDSWLPRCHLENGSFPPCPSHMCVVCVCVSVRDCDCECTSVCMCVCACLCVCVRGRGRVGTGVCVCVCIYTYMYIRIYVCIFRWILHLPCIQMTDALYLYMYEHTLHTYMFVVRVVSVHTCTYVVCACTYARVCVVSVHTCTYVVCACTYACVVCVWTCIRVMHLCVYRYILV